jgi:hypothetical protein
MATINKTYTTRLDSVVLYPEGVRASVSLVDKDDSENVTAHLMIVLKDGKVVQPALDVNVDPAIATASKTLWEAFAKLTDVVTTAQPLLIRGSVPPVQPKRPSRA